jgi:hypothetical protein
VALSRLRSLEGLVLTKPIQMNNIENDPTVLAYSENKLENSDIEAVIENNTHLYLLECIQNAFHFQDLSQSWRNLYFSMNAEQERSVKSKFVNAFQTQQEQILGLLPNAQTFSLQLHRLLTQTPIDFELVLKRVQAAHDYYVPIFEQIHFDLLLVLEQVKRVKRVKEFMDSLLDLDEKITTTMVRLMKIVQFVKLVRQNETITKKSLQTEDVVQYKSKLIAKANKQFRDTLLSVDDVEEDVHEYAGASKKTKKTNKKSTYDETFDLWLNKTSVQDIAAIRKLNESTILNHFEKFVSQNKVQIDELLPKDKIEALAALFEPFKEREIVLAEIKEQVGDLFSWPELKLYRAHFLKDKS